LRKILVIKHGSLGDIISATSVLKDIRDYYLEDELTIITTKKFKNFFLNSPLVNNVIVDDRKGFFISLVIIKKIIKLKPFLIIDLQNSNRTSIYAFFIRFFSKIKINGSGFFSTERYIDNYSSLPSVIDGLSNQIEKLGIKTRRKPFLDWLLDNSIDWKIINNKKFIIINPGCSLNNQQKKWSEKKFSEICSYLNSKKILPIIIGSKDDEKTINKILEYEKNVLNLCNKSPLNIIYQIAKKAMGAISNDTGPAHLISASGCKIHLILSSFSNINTVLPKGYNVSFTQKRNINEISSQEIILEIEKKFNL